MATTPICSIADCGKPAERRGWCTAHYKRWRRHGDPRAGRTPNGEVRQFFEIVLSYEGDDCLIWPYARCAKGYARMNFKGRSQVVSHVLCEEAHGAPPTPQHEAAHSCGKGSSGCVTKRHLSWKTPAENQADKLLHGTHARGERSHFAKLTEERVRAIFWDNRTYEQIAADYEVSVPTISDIKRRHSWFWLSMDPPA